MFSCIFSLLYQACLAAFGLALTALQPIFVPFALLWVVEAFNAIATKNFEVYAVVKGLLSGSFNAMLLCVSRFVEIRVARLRLTIVSFIVDIIHYIFSYFITFAPSTIVEIGMDVAIERHTRSIFNFFILSVVQLRTLPATFLAVFTNPGSAGSSPPTSPSIPSSTRRRSTRGHRRVRPRPIVSTNVLIEVRLLLDLTFASEDLEFNSSPLHTVHSDRDTTTVSFDEPAHVDSSLSSLATSSVDAPPSGFYLATTELDSNEEAVDDALLALPKVMLTDDDFVAVAESSVAITEEPPIVSELPSTGTARPLDSSVSVFAPSCVAVAHPEKPDIYAKPLEFLSTSSASARSTISLETSTCSATSAEIKNKAPAAVDMESKIKILLASGKVDADSSHSTTPCGLSESAVSNPPALSVSCKGKRKENNGSSTPKNVKSDSTPLAPSSRVNTLQPVASATPSLTADAPARAKKVCVPRPEGFSRKQWSKHLAAMHDERRALEAAKLACEKGS